MCGSLPRVGTVPTQTRQLTPSRVAPAGTDCNQITVGDGETRVLAAGTVFFVEDIRGRGHISRAVGGRARTSIFIAVEDHEYLRATGINAGDAAVALQSAAAADSA